MPFFDLVVMGWVLVGILVSEVVLGTGVGFWGSREDSGIDTWHGTEVGGDRGGDEGKGKGGSVWDKEVDGSDEEGCVRDERKVGSEIDWKEDVGDAVGNGCKDEEETEDWQAWEGSQLEEDKEPADREEFFSYRNSSSLNKTCLVT